MALGVALTLARGPSMTLQAPMQFFLVERVQTSKRESVQFSPEVKKVFLKAFKEAGLHVLYELEPPFVSKEHQKYNQVHTGGGPTSGIGYVHRQPQEDGKNELLSDNGQEVALKSDIDSVIWVLDTKEALETADKSGAKYAFIVEILVQPAFRADAPKPVFNVSLKASLCETGTGRVVFAHSESMLKQGWKPMSAVLGACQYLSRRLVQKMQIEE